MFYLLKSTLHDQILHVLVPILWEMQAALSAVRMKLLSVLKVIRQVGLRCFSAHIVQKHSDNEAILCKL